jgi:hypothetical protein
LGSHRLFVSRFLLTLIWMLLITFWSNHYEKCQSNSLGS